VLETKALGIRFGGLHAAENVDLKLYDNEIVGLIGPTARARRRCSTCSPACTSHRGDIRLMGRSIVGRKTYEIVESGIARTFQNIRC
jgi:branched-chain amino acid transport system ATP-binding protein